MKYEYKDMPKERVEKVFELLDRIERGGGEEIAWVVGRVRKEMEEYRVRGR